MKFTRNGSVHLMAGMVVGVGAIVVACGGDDATGTTTPADGGSTSSGGSSSGATSSSGGSSSGGSSGTTSSSGSTTDGGGDAGNDAASEGGTGTKDPGDDCDADNECKSGKCWQQDYCTISCTMKEQTDPVCTALGGDFTGKCNKQGFCQKK